MINKDLGRPATGLPLLRRDKERKSYLMTPATHRPTSVRLLDLMEEDNLPQRRIHLNPAIPELPISLKEKLDTYQDYHQLPRIVEKNKYKSKPNGPHVDYLLTLEKEKSSPRGVGVLRSTPLSGGDVHAPHYFIGKECAHALAHSLKYLSGVDKVQLQGNKLSASSSTKILKRLHAKQTKELDMSDNRLGSAGLSEVTALIENVGCYVKILRLENCGLGLRSIESLCNALAFNTTVKDLSLASNRLGDSAGIFLGEMLQQNSSIEKLDLHWNSLRAPGALKLTEGLKLNEALLQVDLSWNSLAQGDEVHMAENIGNWLYQSTKLRHLDLSFNYLSKEMCRVISTGLKDNRTLIGLHILGNYCEIDPRGFLKPSGTCVKTSNALISPRILKGKNEPENDCRCWICEKWVEVTISLEELPVPPPIFIHFEVDGFEPEIMKDEGYRQVITRVLPPGRPRFFLSTVEGSILTVPDLESEPVDMAVSAVYYEGNSVGIHLKQLQSVSAYEPRYEVKQVPASEPRIPKVVYQPPLVLKGKVPWTISISLFKTYRFNTDKMISDCFEFDWNCSRIAKIIKDPTVLAVCKEKLRAVYKHM